LYVTRKFKNEESGDDPCEMRYALSGRIDLDCKETDITDINTAVRINYDQRTTRIDASYNDPSSAGWSLWTFLTMTSTSSRKKLFQIFLIL
jgi:hypothetical protein